MIPLHTFSPLARNYLVFSPGANQMISMASLREYTIPRGEFKLAMLKRQLHANAQNFSAVRRIENLIERTDQALDEVHRLTSPSFIGSPYGGDQYEEGAATELGLTPCRFSGCEELVNREGRWLRGGFCIACWPKATDPSTSTTEEEIY